MGFKRHDSHCLGTETCTRTPPLLGEPRRVLIVEDHFALRQQLVVLAQSVLPDCEIFEAADGREAQRLATGADFGLIATGARLPDGDGVDLATELRRRHPAAAVIVMSTEDSRPLRKRAEQLGNARLVSARDLGRWLATWLLEGMYPSILRGDPAQAAGHPR